MKKELNIIIDFYIFMATVFNMEREAKCFITVLGIMSNAKRLFDRGWKKHAYDNLIYVISQVRDFEDDDVKYVCMETFCILFDEKREEYTELIDMIKEHFKGGVTA